MAFGFLGLFFLFLMGLLSSGSKKIFWYLLTTAYFLVGAAVVIGFELN